MNIVVGIDETFVTPPLRGTILPGVTRDSVLTLLREKGLPCQERPITIDEVTQASESGRLREAFGCGTAAVICPVGELAYRGSRPMPESRRPSSLRCARAPDGRAGPPRARARPCRYVSRPTFRTGGPPCSCQIRA